LLRAVEVSELARGPHHREVGRLLARLGDLHRLQGRHDAALDDYRRAIGVETRRADPDADIVIHRTHRLIQQLNRLQRYDEAIEGYRDVIERLRDHKGARHPDVAGSLHGLATTLRANGNPAAAEPVLREALEISEDAWGRQHRVTQNVRNQLIRLLDDRDEVHYLGEQDPVSLAPAYPRRTEEDRRVWDDVERLQREDDLPAAIELARHRLEALGATHGERALEVLDPLQRLAVLLERRGLREEALERRREALEVLTAHVADDDPRVLSVLHGLADLLVRLGRHDEAMSHYGAELAVRESRGESNPQLARLLIRMGVAARPEDPALGEEYFHRAAETWEEIAGPDAPERIVALTMLAHTWVARGDAGAAEPLLTELLAGFEAEERPNPASIIGVLQQLRQLYRATGRRDEADTVGSRIAELQKQLQP
jgi:tetratricopeptide (TPR) repeat protein